MALSPPQPLSEHHQLAEFDSGVFLLDDWLRRRARANQASGASRTFVVCDEARVVGYYALASGAVRVAAAPGRFRRNMPEPIPVVILARLAIDRAHQGRGLDRALARDGALRVLNAADAIGIRGIIVHAVSEEAAAFYRAVGFEPSPIEPMMPMATLRDLQHSLLT